MKEILEQIIESLVEKKESVEITEEKNEIGVTYFIKVDNTDMGRIIGKHGKTISSLRTILKAAGLKNRENVRLELIDERNPNQSENNTSEVFPSEETPVNEKPSQEITSEQPTV
ncbi:hypothetical protein A2X44_02015 [candidate division CPR3 bacterium GWF2_35_18]|uniref:RNA-binding protein KhpA n=1 Tax=candidate division CPR3 bacterium GW2011_GWF2_35_18 TaxID=1618350 RepID=A0A0G0ERI2_UNCC3|nr:MAG: hypothetical protein UR67_C0002G0087 [candidate division CPR3 bacterium GW2011_GWF2_35_18]KKP86384.1 MAG: hypothetical protein UR87_C0021G0013 [candidate division CPR3 bacterium GW2011_GWE2_35_7]OGB62775.1 MAG: hypothetical protein A2X44_02015 [candidate division CPR3 bacterium GWF2_35_18]OGB65356.1 MAG: hypothetical protein A2250_00230 [candidate division CPR3 bacterium RIFOXYA2_FULL_35_13]OGB77030.1 MAG: hypothetical protein A2476_01095 [candidate division CPR3 bacterium RIFOXYC2_FULL